MKIRLWKLGSLDHRITPHPEAFAKLKAILQEMEERPDEGSWDIIWDPAIEVEEIEVGPEGINVITGNTPFTPELREKVERMIAEEMGGSAAGEAACTT